MAVAYKRVLIKISGEALAAEKKTGYDFSFVSAVCESVKRCVEMGAEVGIVVGGGNFWRGVKDGDGKIERVSADRMGMLATAMNGLALADVFAQCGVKAKLLTAVDIQGVGERYDTKKAIEYLESGKVVIFGCGTGMPFFSTDTAAVLRAAEIHADAILLQGSRRGEIRRDQLRRRARSAPCGHGLDSHQPGHGQFHPRHRLRPGRTGEHRQGAFGRKARYIGKVIFNL